MRTFYCLTVILLLSFWNKEALRASHINEHEATPTLVSDVRFFDMHGFANVDHVYLEEEHQLIHMLGTYAVTEQHNRYQFSHWDHEKQSCYMSDWFSYLNDIKACFSYMPGIAQIIMGELDLISNAEQKKILHQLLDAKPICFTERDVWLFLENADAPQSINVISLKNIRKNCKKEKLYLLSAALFKPFMRSLTTEYMGCDRDRFDQLIKYYKKDIRKLKPTIRQYLMHMLNVMAMFESPLFDNMNKEEVSAEYIRDVLIYKAIMNLSTEYKALVIVGRWKKAGTLSHAMAACLAVLDRYHIRSFEWIEDDVKDLISYRLNNPGQVISPLDYKVSLTAEDVLTGYCGEICLKMITIDDATLALIRQWNQEGILDLIISEAKKILVKIKPLAFTKNRKPRGLRKTRVA